jgi:hypothetical protein
MIVDAHMHIWNKLDGRIGGKTPVVPLGNGMIRIGEATMLGMPATHLDCSARAEWVVAEFDAAGVDVGVVVQEYLDGEQNAYVQEVQQRFPGRFFVHGLPDFFQPDHVAQEAADLLALGFRGLKLPGGHLALAKIALDDPQFMPIWEQMAAEGQVLSVDLSEGQEQVPQMENILQRYPKLHVAIGHFGMVTRGGWPGQLHLCRHENVYMETGGIIWLCRQEGYPFHRAIEAIHQAHEEVGVEKLMWGSDWPRTMVDFTYRQSLDFIRKEENGLSDAEKRLLLGENAARLYRLPTPTVQRGPAALITEG